MPGPEFLPGSDVATTGVLVVGVATPLRGGRRAGTRAVRFPAGDTDGFAAAVSTLDQQPENRLAERAPLRRGPRLGGGREVRRPRRGRLDGPPAGAQPGRAAVFTDLGGFVFCFLLGFPCC